jgi:hypothetical protein
MTRLVAAGVLMLAALPCCGGTAGDGDAGNEDATIADVSTDVTANDADASDRTAPCGDAACNVETEYCAVNCGVYSWEPGLLYACTVPEGGGAPSCAGDGCDVPVDAGGCAFCDDAGNTNGGLENDAGVWPNCGQCYRSPSTGLVTWTGLCVP